MLDQMDYRKAPNKPALVPQSACFLNLPREIRDQIYETFNELHGTRDGVVCERSDFGPTVDFLSNIHQEDGGNGNWVDRMGQPAQPPFVFPRKDGYYYVHEAFKELIEVCRRPSKPATEIMSLNKQVQHEYLERLDRNTCATFQAELRRGKEDFRSGQHIARDLTRPAAIELRCIRRCNLRITLRVAWLQNFHQGYQVRSILKAIYAVMPSIQILDIDGRLAQTATQEDLGYHSDPMDIRDKYWNVNQFLYSKRLLCGMKMNLRAFRASIRTRDGLLAYQRIEIMETVGGKDVAKCHDYEQVPPTLFNDTVGDSMWQECRSHPSKITRGSTEDTSDDADDAEWI